MLSTIFFQTFFLLQLIEILVIFKHKQNNFKSKKMKNEKNIYEIIKKKYKNLLILKDFGFCEPSFYESSNPEELKTVSNKIFNKNYFFGCGNLEQVSNLNKGETVLDLGCGCGHDCFMAAQKVGIEGQVIGVDILDEMIIRAKENAKQLNLTNINFIVAQIEELPLKDHSIDVIISNCVINLSPQKEKVYREAHRVLKNKGRIAISDIIALNNNLNPMHKDLNLHCACLAGAIQKNELEELLNKIGFKNIEIKVNKLTIEGKNEFEYSNNFGQAYIIAEKSIN